MNTTINGRVGETFAKDGIENEIRMAVTGEMLITKGHPDYYEGASRGKFYSACNQAAQAVSAALATTYTGLLLYNPLNSGVILLPTFVKFALSVAPVAIAPIGLISGWSAAGGVTVETAALTIKNTQIGNGSRAAAGRVLNQATIVTPEWLQMLVDGFTAAALPAPAPPIDLKGQHAILPGGFIAIGALTAVTGLGSIQWEEVRIG